MAVAAPPRPQVSPLAPPSAPEPPAVRQGFTPPEPASTLGDRWAVLLYATCGAVLASLLVLDLAGAFLKAIFR